MYKTKLIEFTNKTGDALRGILLSNGKSVKAVLMCGGFERSTTTEKKFKATADELAKNNIISLRFDYTGCGLSDGDFSQITAERMAGDIQNAADFLKKEVEVKNIFVICHSLSACAIGSLPKDMNFEKIVLLSPALNQKDLLRYWFTISAMEKRNPGTKVNWSNFKNYLDEKNFQEDCLRTDKMTKANYISSAYYLENRDKDYSGYFKNNQNALHIHGDKDDKVPLESLNVKFENEIIVKGGDHDLERPDMFGQWVNKAVDFIGETF